MGPNFTGNNSTHPQEFLKEMDVTLKPEGLILNVMHNNYVKFSFLSKEYTNFLFELACATVYVVLCVTFHVHYPVYVVFTSNLTFHINSDFWTLS